MKTYEMKTKQQTILLHRPYLNDDKELVFLYSDAFNPTTEIVLCEHKNSIELREPSSKKQVFISLRGNEPLLKQAVDKKKEIMDLLKEYTKKLQAGTEKVIVFSIGGKVPYLFTTESIQKYGELSCKFVSGFLYFVNKRLKEKNIPLQFSSYDEMQLRFNEFFKETKMQDFKSGKWENEEVWMLPFKNFIDLLG